MPKGKKKHDWSIISSKNKSGKNIEKNIYDLSNDNAESFVKNPRRKIYDAKYKYRHDSLKPDSSAIFIDVSPKSQGISSVRKATRRKTVKAPRITRAIDKNDAIYKQIAEEVNLSKELNDSVHSIAITASIPIQGIHESSENCPQLRSRTLKRLMNIVESSADVLTKQICLSNDLSNGSASIFTSIGSDCNIVSIINNEILDTEHNRTSNSSNKSKINNKSKNNNGSFINNTLCDNINGKIIDNSNHKGFLYSLRSDYNSKSIIDGNSINNNESINSNKSINSSKSIIAINANKSNSKVVDEKFSKTDKSINSNNFDCCNKSINGGEKPVKNSNNLNNTRQSIITINEKDIANIHGSCDIDKITDQYTERDDRDCDNLALPEPMTCQNKNNDTFSINDCSVGDPADIILGDVTFICKDDTAAEFYNSNISNNGSEPILSSEESHECHHNQSYSVLNFTNYSDVSGITRLSNFSRLSTSTLLKNSSMAMQSTRNINKTERCSKTDIFYNDMQKSVHQELDECENPNDSLDAVQNSTFNKSVSHGKDNTIEMSHESSFNASKSNVLSQSIGYSNTNVLEVLQSYPLNASKTKAFEDNVLLNNREVNKSYNFENKIVEDEQSDKTIVSNSSLDIIQNSTINNTTFDKSVSCGEHNTIEMSYESSFNATKSMVLSQSIGYSNIDKVLQMNHRETSTNPLNASKTKSFEDRVLVENGEVNKSYNDEDHISEDEQSDNTIVSNDSLINFANKENINSGIDIESNITKKRKVPIFQKTGEKKVYLIDASLSIDLDTSDNQKSTKQLSDFLPQTAEEIKSNTFVDNSNSLNVRNNTVVSDNTATEKDLIKSHSASKGDVIANTLDKSSCSMQLRLRSKITFPYSVNGDDSSVEYIEKSGSKEIGSVECFSKNNKGGKGAKNARNVKRKIVKDSKNIISTQAFDETNSNSTLTDSSTINIPCRNSIRGSCTHSEMPDDSNIDDIVEFVSKGSKSTNIITECISNDKSNLNSIKDTQDSSKRTKNRPQLKSTNGQSTLPLPISPQVDGAHSILDDSNIDNIVERVSKGIENATVFISNDKSNLNSIKDTRDSSKRTKNRPQSKSTNDQSTLPLPFSPQVDGAHSILDCSSMSKSLSPKTDTIDKNTDKRDSTVISRAIISEQSFDHPNLSQTSISEIPYPHSYIRISCESKLVDVTRSDPIVKSMKMSVDSNSTLKTTNHNTIPHFDSNYNNSTVKSVVNDEQLVNKTLPLLNTEKNLVTSKTVKSNVKRGKSRNNIECVNSMMLNIANIAEHSDPMIDARKSSLVSDETQNKIPYAKSICTADEDPVDNSFNDNVSCTNKSMDTFHEHMPGKYNAQMISERIYMESTRIMDVSKNADFMANMSPITGRRRSTIYDDHNHSSEEDDDIDDVDIDSDDDSSCMTPVNILPVSPSPFTKDHTHKLSLSNHCSVIEEESEYNDDSVQQIDDDDDCDPNDGVNDNADLDSVIEEESEYNDDSGQEMDDDSVNNNVDLDAISSVDSRQFIPLNDITPDSNDHDIKQCRTPCLDKSYINPTDSRKTQLWIVRENGKRTRALPSGKLHRVIYEWDPVQKANLIKCREVEASPHTIKRRKENELNDKQRKVTETNVTKFKKPWKRHCVQSEDGIHVDVIDNETKEKYKLKVIVTKEEADRCGNKKERLRTLSYMEETNLMINGKGDTILQLETRKKKSTSPPALVVIDRSKINLEYGQYLLVPQNIHFFIFNPNKCKITVKDCR